jgi:glucan phosphoethanolaminetransferase (alkaline phosphatase superfamily)
MKSTKSIGIISIILGALATFTVLAYQISPSRPLAEIPKNLGFYLWVSLPFAVLIILTSRINRKEDSPASRVAIFITSVLVSILSVLTYWLLSRYSGNGIVVILKVLFVPIYTLIEIAFVYWLTRAMCKGFFISNIKMESPARAAPDDSSNRTSN